MSNTNENIDHLLEMDIKQLKLLKLKNEKSYSDFQKDKLEHNRNNCRWLNDDEKIILKEFLNWLHDGDDKHLNTGDFPFSEDYQELMTLYKKSMAFAYEDVNLGKKINEITKAIDIKTEQKK